MAYVQIEKYRALVIARALLLALCLIQLSCKKFLAEKSDKNVTELQSLEDLQALLDDDGIMNTGTPGFGETSSDDYFILSSTYDGRDDESKTAYTWRSNDYNYSNDWATNYNAIYNANYCIDYLKNITINNQNQIQYNNIKGSALFHRAYRNLSLIWQYGKAYDENSSSSDLGIVLRLSSDPSQPSNRSTVKESYDRIIMDVRESVALLPDIGINKLRPSKASAYGLLARVYLSMRNYDSAYKYSDLCLQINDDLMDFKDGAQVNPTGRPPFQPLNKEIIFFSTQAGNYSTKSPFVALIDTVLISSFDSNDIRKTAYFFENMGYLSFKGSYNSQNTYVFFSGITTGEMYLTRAECYARGTNGNPGDPNNALQDLNALLSTRYDTSFSPVVVTDANEALSRILLERRKELLMRGLRWIDLKRLNKEGRNIILTRIADQVYTLQPNDNKYALPVPKDILELTGIQQNPGW